MSVLIYQHVMMHYRVPVFNQLVEQLGTPVTVACGSFGSEIQTEGLDFRLLTLSQSTVGPFRRVPELQSLMQKFDIVILPFDVHELSVLRALLKRNPTVLWGHSHGSRTIFRPLRRWMAANASSVLLYTEQGKQKLVQEGLNESKLFVANNTVDIQNSSFSSEVQRTSFLFSGRITERKKINEAIDAFASLSESMPDYVRFEIVGDGPERGALEQQVRESGLDSRVDFHGFVYDAEKLKGIFQRSLGFVSPGHVGLAVLHSFAYGVPPLTRREARHAPEFQHIHDQENGLLFDGSRQDLANKMRALTQGSLSFDLGRKGFDYYQSNCTLDRATTGIVAAIRHALGKD